MVSNLVGDSVWAVWLAANTLLWVIALWTVFQSPKFRNRIAWAALVLLVPFGGVPVLLVAWLAPRPRRPSRIDLTGA